MNAFDLTAGLLIAHDETEAALTLLSHRDEIIRAAFEGGFTKMQIFRLTGISRTTIDRILAGPEVWA